MQFLSRMIRRKSIQFCILGPTGLVFSITKLPSYPITKFSASLWHRDVFMNNSKHAFSTTQENLCDTGI
jgi:hypothetical protein